MSILTGNEFIVAKYMVELQSNTLTNESRQNIIKLLQAGVDVSGGNLGHMLAMILLSEYLYNDDKFLNEYKALRLEDFFLNETHIIEMKEKLVALSNIHIGAFANEALPLLKDFVSTVEQYDDLMETSLKGLYNTVLSLLYRRQALSLDLEFSNYLINKLDSMTEILNSDFSIVDMVLGGKPYED